MEEEVPASVTGAQSRRTDEETDGDSVVFLDDCKLLEVIAEGSLKFEEWTSLISLTEKTYPEDMDKISLVYNPFLSEYPLCYVYWRKYLNHTIKLCTPEKAVEVFERAVESAMYCVDVWVDYCTFGCLAFGDPADTRRLFKRAMSFVGKDYLCHTLWDKYIEFEFTQQRWDSLAEIYVQALRFPTKKLHKYYDSFKELVGVLKDEMGVQSESTLDEPVEPVLNGEVSSYKQDKLSGIIKDLLDPSSASVGFKALQEYKATGEYFYQNSCLLNEKISSFEASINPSYFDVKPLEVSQLENWHQYLDFAESHGDFDWALKLYERCLVPCANYPEVWIRYVEFMESKGGRELADFALSRATKTFVKNISVMHLCNAWFKEHLGDVSNARAAFLDCNVESDSDFVESVIRKANMEKRLIADILPECQGNFKAAARTCKQALKVAVTMGKHDVLPLIYIHFSRLKYMMADSEDAAIGILTDAIKKIPGSKLLIEELIKFAMAHKGSRHINIVNSVVADALSVSSSSSKGLSTQDGEDISRLYLEFVDLCGNIHDVRKAWTRHVRLFPHLVRTPHFHGANGRQWIMCASQMIEKDNLLPHDSGNQVQPSSPEDRPVPSENHNEMIIDKDNTHQMNESTDEVTADLLQSGATDTTMQEEVKDNAPEQDQGSSKTDSAEVPSQFLKGNVEKTDNSIDLPEKDSNPLQLEKLSLEPQQTQFPGALNHDSQVPKRSDSILPTPADCQASDGINLPNKLMLETGHDAVAADIHDLSSSPVSTSAAVVHVDGLNSSAGDHNRGRYQRQTNKTEGHRDRSRRSRWGSPHRQYADVEPDPRSSTQPLDSLQNPQDPQGTQFQAMQSDTAQHLQPSQENAYYEQMWQQYYYHYQQQLLLLQQQLQQPQNQEAQQQMYLQQQYQYQMQQLQYLQSLSQPQQLQLMQQYYHQMYMQQSYQSEQQTYNQQFQQQHQLYYYQQQQQAAEVLQQQQYEDQGQTSLPSSNNTSQPPQVCSENFT
ncbi:Pre-mRNA-processing factor 39-2 [Linum grandiflorum]